MIYKKPALLSFSNDELNAYMSAMASDCYSGHFPESGYCYRGHTDTGKSCAYSHQYG